MAGPGVARGYANSPELTAQKFIVIDGTRWYRTGDRGAWTSDGNLLYYGRGDVLPLVAAPSVLGVFMGSRTSARLAGRLHGGTIRKIFAGFMIIVAIQLLLKAKGWWVS